MESTTYLDIQLKPAPLQSKKPLLITDEIIRWGDKSINCKDITAVKYGSMRLGTMGIQTNQNYSFKFLDKGANVFPIYFSSVSLAAPDEKLEDAFSNIEEAVGYAVTDRIMKEWIQTLNSGASVNVCDVSIMTSGIKIKISKLFSSRFADISWNN